ncbi:MAG TPA: DUF4258 domain-containing protein [Pyrinomonadaceae bacterium]|nr:DUF4258 domain-containing protein [Pyrinomonadaceae bacterium]
MARRNIDDIRDKVRIGKYDMTVHAVEEMAEDSLDILDLEQSILYGRVSRIEKDDPRGSKYVIEGPAIEEQISVGSVGRFVDDRYLVITVYAITASEH